VYKRQNELFAYLIFTISFLISHSARKWSLRNVNRKFLF